MTLIVELPDKKEAALKAKAESQGVSPEQYAAKLLIGIWKRPPVWTRARRASIFLK
jgi:hypothetical protein